MFAQGWNRTSQKKINKYRNRHTDIFRLYNNVYHKQNLNQRLSYKWLQMLESVYSHQAQAQHV